MSDPFQQPGDGPADPPGYRIRYADDGGFEVIRILGEKLIGHADTREEAVQLALADQAARS